MLSEDLGGGFLGDLVAAGWRRVLNGAVVSAKVHALMCGVRMSLGGESTPSAGFVLGDHGFAQVADFQQLTAHFPMAFTVQQQQSKHWEQ